VSANRLRGVSELLRYWVFLRVEEDNSYSVTCPDFPEWSGKGVTFEACVEATRRELTELAQAILKEGGDLPRPSDLGDVRLQRMMRAPAGELVLAIRISGLKPNDKSAAPISYRS
jgi:predicted RNase H-like HicB family nuclease